MVLDVYGCACESVKTSKGGHAAQQSGVDDPRSTNGERQQQQHQQYRRTFAVGRLVKANDG